MKTVTSDSNDTYKYLKQLSASSKHRRRTSRTLLEGIHLAKSYLDQIGSPELCIYSESATDNPEVAEIIARCTELSAQVVLLSDSHLRAISGVDNGIGIMFAIEIPESNSPGSLDRDALLLEGVQDPGNMGTILRTAAAAGVTDVYTSSGSSSVWSPKVLRSGMGAHFALSIYENVNLTDMIENASVQILATSLDAKTSIYSKDLSIPTVWLFGNEGGGVSQQLLSQDVEKVIIPQNADVESLNVSASVAVCLFEQVRQRHTN